MIIKKKTKIMTIFIDKNSKKIVQLNFNTKLPEFSRFPRRM